MAKFYTSDIHAFHKKIVSFTNRGLETTQENHEVWLKDLWNNQVGHGDLTYILGDVSFGDYKSTKLFLQFLNGQKIIIKGNHDRREDLDKLVKENVIQAWYEYKEVKIKDRSVVLFHFPIASWHKQSHGGWHLHGHSHGNYAGQGKILDVGIDNSFNIYAHHRLFSEDDIDECMSYKDSYVADNHRKVY